MSLQEQCGAYLRQRLSVERIPLLKSNSIPKRRTPSAAPLEKSCFETEDGKTDLMHPLTVYPIIAFFYLLSDIRSILIILKHVDFPILFNIFYNNVHLLCFI